MKKIPVSRYASLDEALFYWKCHRLCLKLLHFNETLRCKYGKGKDFYLNINIYLEIIIPWIPTRISSKRSRLSPPQVTKQPSKP